MNFILAGVLMFFSFCMGAALTVMVYHNKWFAGTLILNLSRDDKDIAQFVLDKPLSDISKGDWAVLKVKTNDSIKSLSEVSQK